jgi:hypothetical protein
LGCDWKAVSRLLTTLAPMGRGEKEKRYSTDTK